MNDIADTPRLAVIAKRLPYIDRRSLSEAWFSALHLISHARPEGRTHELRSCLPNGERSASPSVRSQSRPAVRAPAPATRGATVVVGRTPLAASDVVAKRPCSVAAKASARPAYARARSYPPFRTSLNVGVDGGRVRLLLRREGATLHVVALCRPEIAALVGRALAAADAHLRLRGDFVRSSVQVEAGAVRA